MREYQTCQSCFTNFLCDVEDPKDLCECPTCSESEVKLIAELETIE